MIWLQALFIIDILYIHIHIHIHIQEGIGVIVE